MLCGETPSSFIMSKTQITSASCAVASAPSMFTPSFLPSRNPSRSRQRTSQRLVTNHRRLPSQNGTEQMPSCGQSWTRPEGSFGLECCQRNLPVAASKHSRQPRSTSGLNRGSQPPVLLVPTRILPLWITALPYEREPSLAAHLMFLALSGIQLLVL